MIWQWIISLICLLASQSSTLALQDKTNPPAPTGGNNVNPAATVFESDDFLQGLNDHLEVVRGQMTDTAFPLARREAIASETLAMLRGKVSEAPSPDDTLRTWAMIIDLAEEFSSRHPGHPMSDRFKLTIAEAWWQRSRLLARIETLQNPFQKPVQAIADRQKAQALLEKMVTTNGPANDLFAQNARYLMAQCLSDELATTRPLEKKQELATRQRIIDLCQNLDAEPVKDWGHVLRAQNQSGLGNNDQAFTELEGISQGFRHRYAQIWAETKVLVLSKADRWDEADQFLRSTDLPVSLFGRLEIALWADRNQQPLDTTQKKKLVATIYEAAEKIRDRTDRDALEGFRLLSQSNIEPPPEGPSQSWDLLAKAHLQTGQTRLAATCLDNASKLALKENNPSQHIAYLYQAGAAWLKAGDPNFAQDRMRQILESSAQAELGPKASLLRILSLRKMGIAGQQMLNLALEYHLKTFDKDTLSTGEVRWIEGETKAQSGLRDEAIAAWEKIPPDHARWLQAQIAMSKLALEYLDELVLISDTKTFATQWDVTRRRLERARDTAPSTQDKYTIELAIARVDLTPGSDRVDAARQTCLRILPLLTRDNQRQWAQSLLILADALIGRKLDLENRLNERDRQMDVSLLLDMCRVLDTSAQIIDNESTRRQLGSAMGRLTESLPPSSPSFSPEVNQELELRTIRGLIYAGQPTAAEPRLDTWLKKYPDVKPTLLYAVADALLKLNATAKSIDYLGAWLSQTSEGSIQWFLGRLELAKALYREGRDDEARKLIDATLLLYPDAGGQGLKKKYERFRRTLANSNKIKSKSS